MLEKECEYLSVALTSKAKFIQMVINGSINLTTGRASKVETIHRLRSYGFPTKSDLEKFRHLDDLPLITPEDTVTDEDEGSNDFDYLLSLPLASLTSDRIDSLEREASKSEDALIKIRKHTAEDLWNQDIDRLLPHL